MFNRAKGLLRKTASTREAKQAFTLPRPLVLLQSDDWGRIGVRDKEGYEQLRSRGVRLGEHPYDFYTLETADDVHALRECLKRHRDATGRPACMEMNFIMSSLDFPRMYAENCRAIQLLPLTAGLPGRWNRPGLFDAYRQGVLECVFQPALHGLTHFCPIPVEHALRRNEERAALLRTLWIAETPYIYWRMPWMGYEYCNPERPHAGFLSLADQNQRIQEACNIFEKMFGFKAASACAPGYRANRDTHSAWARAGVRVAQKGSESPQLPYRDEFGLLNLFRTIDFEPFERELSAEKYVELAAECFTRGLPAVISVHAINFHSTLRDFRSVTVAKLDQFLFALERKFPNLLYVHDTDLYEIVTRGKYQTAQGKVSVEAVPSGQGKSRSAAGGIS